MTGFLDNPRHKGWSKLWSLRNATERAAVVRTAAISNEEHDRPTIHCQHRTLKKFVLNGVLFWQVTPLSFVNCNMLY
jgi:hypothetical protein